VKSGASSRQRASRLSASASRPSRAANSANMRIAATSVGNCFRCARSSVSATARRPSHSAAAGASKRGSRVEALMCLAYAAAAPTCRPSRTGDRRAGASRRRGRRNPQCAPQGCPRRLHPGPRHRAPAAFVAGSCEDRLRLRVARDDLRISSACSIASDGSRRAAATRARAQPRASPRAHWRRSSMIPVF